MKLIVVIATENKIKEETEIYSGHLIFTIYSKAKISSVDEVKGRLLQLLLNQSQGLLMNSGCPIEKVSTAKYAYTIKTVENQLECKGSL